MERVMDFRLSRHALEELERRGIPYQLVSEVLQNPQQIVPEMESKKAYQSQVSMGGKTYLLRVIVDDRIEPAVVVTVYRTSKIQKYWRAP